MLTGSPTDRELERKAYVASLLSRTPAEIAEEDFLYVESRRIEQNYHKIAAERAELLHLLGGRDGIGMSGSGAQSGLAGFGQGGMGGKEADRRRKGPGWDYAGSANALPEGWAGEGSKRRATAEEGEPARVVEYEGVC